LFLECLGKTSEARGTTVPDPDRKRLLIRIGGHLQFQDWCLFRKVKMPSYLGAGFPNGSPNDPTHWRHIALPKVLIEADALAQIVSNAIVGDEGAVSMLDAD
jgi:hypothetical protein